MNAIEGNIFAVHTVHYIDENDNQRDLEIEFSLIGVDRQDVGDGEYYDLHIASARFNLFGEQEVVRAYGDNNVQVLLRLVRLLGVVLRDAAASNGVELYKYEPGDAEQVEDLFS